MPNYRNEVKEYTSWLTSRTEKLALNAIKKLRGKDYHKSWQWIYTALALKEPDTWETYGMGLLFNDSYQKQVLWELEYENKIQHIEEESSKIDVDEFWNSMSDENDWSDE